MMEPQLSQTWEDRLQQQYPEMFPRGGISVDKGWQPIVERLCYAIDQYTKAVNSRHQWYIDKHPDHDPPDPVAQVVVAQIKEKFGQLRFYYDGGDQYVEGMVAMAEEWANVTCEVCGEHGRIRTDLSWAKTLCRRHYDERFAAQRKRFEQWIEP